MTGCQPVGKPPVDINNLTWFSPNSSRRAIIGTASIGTIIRSWSVDTIYDSEPGTGRHARPVLQLLPHRRSGQTCGRDDYTPHAQAWPGPARPGPIFGLAFGGIGAVTIAVSAAAPKGWAGWCWRACCRGTSAAQPRRLLPPFRAGVRADDAAAGAHHARAVM
jgi:hypothetical protein